MRKPLVSVIIPVYNVEKYLQRCIDSVISQTYENLEIICINDGSTDGSCEILKQNKIKEKRLIVLEQKNKGVSNARNRGVKIAKGEFIIFIDSDDTLENDMIKFLVECFNKYEVDIVHCTYNRIENNKIIKRINNIKSPYFQDNSQGVIDLLEGKKVDPTLCTKLFKKKLFENIEIDESINTNEDLLLNFYLFRQAKLSVYLDVAKYNYIYRKGSASTSEMTLKKLEDQIKVSKKISKELELEEQLYKYSIKSSIGRLGEVYKSIINLNDKKMNDFKKYVIKEVKKIYPSFYKQKNVSFKRKLVFFLLSYNTSLYDFSYKIYKKIKG
ncbi:glycosyltransferase family 2 protein [Clostridium perfringens]|nr:glycosyltransferase family 2 protein [Clostridium perfringens]